MEWSRQKQQKAAESSRKQQSLIGLSGCGEIVALFEPTPKFCAAVGRYNMIPHTILDARWVNNVS